MMTTSFTVEIIQVNDLAEYLVHSRYRVNVDSLLSSFSSPL